MNERPQVPSEQVEEGIRAKYRQVAVKASGHFPYPVGRRSAERLRYEPDALAGIPSEVIDRFVGVGNPFSVRRPEPGERVLDIGCGCGFDTLVAARFVGATGRVVGIDLSPEMLALARRHAPAGAAKRVDLVEGSVARLPFGDGSFDMVISNGVLNLIADKDVAFREIARVLRSGGTLAVADLLVVREVPDEVLKDPAAWAT